MIGLLLLFLIAASGSWFGWLYFVSPGSDQERIKADKGGTGVQILDIKRVGTQHLRPELSWVGGHPTPRTGGKWFRIYEVAAIGANGDPQNYSVAVEARLIGLSELKRIDLRA